MDFLVITRTKMLLGTDHMFAYAKGGRKEGREERRERKREGKRRRV